MCRERGQEKKEELIRDKQDRLTEIFEICIQTTH